MRCDAMRERGESDGESGMRRESETDEREDEDDKKGEPGNHGGATCDHDPRSATARTGLSIHELQNRGMCAPTAELR